MTARAISSVVFIRLLGAPCAACSGVTLKNARLSSIIWVRAASGLMEFTRTFLSANSMAATLVRPMMACLDAA